MAEQRTRNGHNKQEDNLVGDELDMLEAEVEDEDTEDLEKTADRNRRLDMRQRIEEKLEERRLMKELNEYEFFELDEDTLH